MSGVGVPGYNFKFNAEFVAVSLDEWTTPKLYDSQTLIYKHIELEVSSLLKKLN